MREQSVKELPKKVEHGYKEISANIEKLKSRRAVWIIVGIGCFGWIIFLVVFTMFTFMGFEEEIELLIANPQVIVLPIGVVISIIFFLRNHTKLKKMKKEMEGMVE